MIFATIRRWFRRPGSTSNQSQSSAENLFVVPGIAAGAVHPTESDGDANEAAEGIEVDTSDAPDTSGGESTCGASCGAMYP